MHKKSRRVNKRQIRRSRKGGRRMRMKGGLDLLNLQQIDSQYLKMRKRYSFEKHNFIPYFKQYVFGVEAQRDAWELLLTQCQLKGVPVFILSAGNKIGIIRMLQLMDLDAMFEEVLCTNNNELVNPLITTSDRRHNFQGQTKYTVIRTILRERFPTGDNSDPLVTTGPPIGYLMDDDVNNDDPTVPNKSIPFENVKSKDPQIPEQTSNMFYDFVDTYPESLQPLIQSRAFADVNVINQVASKVEQDSNIKILFIDFDKTFSQYAGALPFHDYNFTMAFDERFTISPTNLWR